VLHAQSGQYTGLWWKRKAYRVSRHQHGKHASDHLASKTASTHVQELYKACSMLRLAMIWCYGGNARQSRVHVTNTANTQVGRKWDASGNLAKGTVFPRLQELYTVCSMLRAADTSSCGGNARQNIKDGSTPSRTRKCCISTETKVGVPGKYTGASYRLRSVHWWSLHTSQGIFPRLRVDSVASEHQKHPTGKMQLDS
jgi:hypothetical protein